MAMGTAIYQEAADRFAAQPKLAVSLVFACVTAAWLASWAIQRPPKHPDAPEFISDAHGNDFFAAWRFFSRRWDFLQEGTRSRLRNFSFWIGKYPMVALTGAKARETFYNHRALSVNEGYSIFFGVMPSSKVTGKNGEDISYHTDYEPFLNKAVNRMYTRDKMRSYLPNMIDEVEKCYKELSEQPERKINPFKDIYRMSYSVSMLIWGCAEICRDSKTLGLMFRAYEDFKYAFTPTLIVFPWLPTMAMFRKFKLGGTIWWTLNNAIKKRQKVGNRENDICQAMLDNGDTRGNIVGVIMTLLFAGHAQLGANAAWIFTFLASNAEWYARTRKEVLEVAKRHCTDPSLSVLEVLRGLPLEAWENEFPMIELCFRDSMRLNTTFSCFRRNVGLEPVQVGKDVVPSGWYCTYHIADVNLDPNIHPDPEKWDPSRYLDENGEEKKHQPEFIGFGAGRHPCIGMKFARVAEVIIVALFLATFDFDLVDREGKQLHEQPMRDFNDCKDSIPLEPVFVRYSPVKSMTIAQLAS